MERHHVMPDAPKYCAEVFKDIWGHNYETRRKEVKNLVEVPVQDHETKHVRKVNG